MELRSVLQIFIALCMISQIEAYARAAIHARLAGAYPLSAPAITVCYSKDGISCIPGWRVLLLLKEDLETDEGRTGMGLERDAQIPHTFYKDNIWIIFSACDGDHCEREVVDVSHSPAGSTHETMIFHGSIAFSFALSCQPDFYGIDCNIGCKPVPNDHECDANGAYVCLAGRSGKHCDIVTLPPLPDAHELKTASSSSSDGSSRMALVTLLSFFLCAMACVIYSIHRRQTRKEAQIDEAQPMVLIIDSSSSA